MFRKLFITAGVAAVAAVGVVGTAQAYDAPAGQQFGKYLNTNVVTDPGTGASTTIKNVDMNVQLGNGTDWYHEFDLNYDTPSPDGVITFNGVGKQFDNGGELITGVLDTTNHTVTWKSQYVNEDGTTQGPGRVWEATGASLDATKTSGDIDWTGSWNGFALTGGFHNVPAATPAPVAGNHGQYVSGAVKAGIKGKALAAIAQNGSLVGPYPTS